MIWQACIVFGAVLGITGEGWWLFFLTVAGAIIDVGWGAPRAGRAAPKTISGRRLGDARASAPGER